MYVGNISTYGDSGAVASTVAATAANKRTVDAAPKQASRPRTEDQNANVKAAAEKAYSENVQVDRQGLDKAIEQLQATASMVDVGLRFKVDDKTNMVQIVVMNEETEEVIRELPPTEVIKAAARIKEVIGLLIDETA